MDWTGGDCMKLFLMLYLKHCCELDMENSAREGMSRGKYVIQHEVKPLKVLYLSRDP